MKNRKRGIGKVIGYIVVAALLLCIAAGVFGNTIGSANGIRKGLDLAGGVSIAYEATKKNPTAQEMADTVEKMRLRAELYSTESQVYQEGTKRVVVDIPDVTDADAVLEQLGKAGSIQFIPVTDSAIKMQADGTYKLQDTIENLKEKGLVLVDGSDISTASANTVQNENGIGNSYIVELELNSAGAKKFADATEEYLYQQIAIVYDEEVISAPVVQAHITDGKAQISGQKTLEEAQKLASIIRIGALPIELKEVRSNTVGAKLGDNALQTSLLAGLIGLIIVFVLMIAVYKVSGIAASLALLAYISIELILLNLLQITLTLPGIAGIILSIGMAVDANVIIFTRIKEELGLGKTVRTAIANGFNKAFSAIFDGNITTIIAAIVLGIFGTGTIKGFAYTLALGIIISMFSAIVITRFLLNAFYDIGADDEKYFGTKVDKEQKPFVKWAPKFFILSGIIIAVGIITMSVNAARGKGAFNYALEFSGGTSTEVVFENATLPANDEMKDFVAKTIGDSQVDVTPITNDNALLIRTKTLTLDERTKLHDALEETYKVTESNITNENISAAVSGEMKRSALMSVIAATICMLIYIVFRFKNLAFGTAAVTALVHDVMVLVTFYALARMSVGNTFIACVLTIVGYSINATIIIFDRIRENMKNMGRKDDLERVVNNSITQTFSRSVNTTLTTLVMVVVLFIMGVESVREFSLPLIIGLICGCYSSVCITGSLWYFMHTAGKKKEK